MPETRKMQRPVSPTATRDADDRPRGNCYGTDDPELWFSNDFRDQSLAALICSTCPLRNECATVAIERSEWGVWGGLTEEDRAGLAKKRRAELCSKGHAWTPENTRVNGAGHRMCVTCRRAGDRIRKERDREKLNAQARDRYHAAKELTV